MRQTILFLFFYLAAFSAFTENYQPKNLTEVQAQYNLLVDLRNDESISEEVFLEKSKNLKQIAKKEFDIDLDGLKLQQIVPVQKIDWVASALYVISAILVFLLLGPLISKYKKRFTVFLRKIWSVLSNIGWLRFLVFQVVRFVGYWWEFIGYGLLGSSLVYFQHEYVVLLVSFILGVLSSYSIMSRHPKGKKEQFIRAYFIVLTLMWGGIAYWFDNGFVGFLTVISFVASLGFNISVHSRVIEIGFKQHGTRFIVQLTGITLLLSLLSWLIFYTQYLPLFSTLKHHLDIFKVGLVSLVPLVYFVGLGYLSFFVFKKRKTYRLFSEVIAFSSGVAVLIIALLYQISSMFWIGLFFMSWDLVDKYYEFLYYRIDKVWSGLLLALILGASGYFIKSNMSEIMSFISILQL